jgi:hypothetical protein
LQRGCWGRSRGNESLTPKSPARLFRPSR